MSQVDLNKGLSTAISLDDLTTAISFEELKICPEVTNSNNDFSLLHDSYTSSSFFTNFDSETSNTFESLFEDLRETESSSNGN